ncbi:MAG: YihA family ribosome biosis GTP-binding protein [Francisellaceae bacterium]|nr:YihA family ribosome biosis GTP-binding protein [Francisellaceae bacterium]
MTLNYQTIEFIKSAAQIKDLPEGEAPEVAFVGRSNSGKSSAINSITGIKNLARTSKTPGRTQLINFFKVEDAFLVDLPGYGYAKVPFAIKERWQKVLMRYLNERENLKGLVLIMDCRHPLTDLDWGLIRGVRPTLPIHCLLTKADKFSRGAGLTVLHQVKQNLQSHSLISLQLFSALKLTGVEEARQKLDEWLLP